MADSTYHFLAFVRSGFAASITQPDTLGSAQPALATAPVGVTVSGVAEPVRHKAVVRGPGDVIGLSASQVVRTDPIDGAVGVEPNYFAQIEFDRPDLPWLFTPAAAVGDRLRPWIVLVVLDAEGPAAATVKPGAPLPVLHVSSEAATALPDLAASYLWAHAQAILPDGTTLQQAFAPGADPRLTISRLMCPRHLSPNRWYVAAVVPAFNVGRLAGLGQDITPEDEAKLEPAWRADAAVDLPVYHSWRFRTGEDADFESLARKLKGRPLPEGVGTRALDVSRPGAGLPALPAATSVQDTKAITWLDGALRPIDSDKLPARDADATKTFQQTLTVLLDQPANLVMQGHADPVIAPPIYGGQHALAVKVDIGTVPPWISELNLDPRTRVAAGLGTQVVQSRQEDYVARAWRQLGDVLAANRLLRSAQFARTSSLRVHARLATLDAASMLGLAHPAHQRVAGVLDVGQTLYRSLKTTRLPPITLEPAFRRVTRASSAVTRAAGNPALAAATVEKFAAQLFTVPNNAPDGTVGMRPATEVIGAVAASAVLAALGDAESSNAGRLDTTLATLTSAQADLPSGATLRTMTLRADTGAVAVTKSLGAVPAATINAVLNAAFVETATPASPPPAPPTTPLSEPTLPARPFVPVHLPTGLTRARGVSPAPAAVARRAEAARLSPALGDMVFVPAGPSRPIGTGATLRGGSVVIENATIQKIATQPGTVTKLDDTRWQTLASTAAVPAVSTTADPLSDAGSRLNVLRQDPASLTALAQAASGDVTAVQTLDLQSASLATAGAAKASFAALAIGTFAPLLPEVQRELAGADDLAAGREMVSSVADAFDRMVNIDDAPATPAAPAFDLTRARTALLKKLDPAVTVSARLVGRISSRVVTGVARRDDLDPIMACPQFNDPMWQALRDLGPDWLLPGLQLVPPDTATLVRTNPRFVAAHLVGLNHEMMRELLWREYPTDQRGTAFHRFWGRSGPEPDDVGNVHEYSRELQRMLKTSGDEAVLLLRSELLRRYPGSIIYLCRATAGTDGLPQLDDTTLVLPGFRGDLPPDVTFVGFPIDPDELYETTNPWWFVIAQPPAEPRFGLDDWSATTPALPMTANELAWNHMAADGNPTTETDFAIADPQVLRGRLIDGMGWGANAAGQAQLTYQHPVRVAIRAADLLPPQVPT